jgi:TfoX N-terminal domain
VAYDAELANRIRTAVEAAAGAAGYREISMFGGLCWTVNTHMAVGAAGDDLMVHVGTDGVADALEHGARHATMGERTMGGMVLVAAADLADAAAMDAWVGPAVQRSRAKQPKKPRTSTAPKAPST